MKKVILLTSVIGFLLGFCTVKYGNVVLISTKSFFFPEYKFQNGEIVKILKDREYGVIVIRFADGCDAIAQRWYVKEIPSGRSNSYYEFELEKLTEEETPDIKTIYGY